LAGAGAFIALNWHSSSTCSSTWVLGEKRGGGSKEKWSKCRDPELVFIRNPQL